MSNFLVFFGTDFYPFGGMWDCVGDFSTEELAQEKIKQLTAITKDSLFERHWAQIYNVQDRKLIYAIGTSCYSPETSVPCDLEKIIPTIERDC